MEMERGRSRHIPTRVVEAKNGISLSAILSINDKLTAVYGSQFAIFGGTAILMMTGKPRENYEGKYARLSDVDVFVPAMTGEYASLLRKQELVPSDGLDGHCYIYHKDPDIGYIPIDLTFAFGREFFGVPYSIISETVVPLALSRDGSVQQSIPASGNPVMVVGTPMLVIFKALARGRHEKDARDLRRLIETHYGGSSSRFIEEEGELIKRVVDSNPDLSRAVLEYSLRSS